VRDFVIAASPSWRTARGRSTDGETTILAHTRRLDGRRLVELAREELARYERITGVAYPYPVYRIAESGGGLPMEAPALTWIPGSRSASEMPFLVSHETAHQWWYGLVGNDQSTNAFADEAMADYFSRKAHLSIRPSRCPRDRLDRDIRAYSTFCYFEVIYVQGARFLEGLRQDFGTDPFRRAVRAYTQDNRLAIGSNSKLLEAFRAEMGEGVRRRFQSRFPSLY
jgi:aminopeptidase N